MVSSGFLKWFISFAMYVVWMDIKQFGAVSYAFCKRLGNVIAHCLVRAHSASDFVVPWAGIF